MLTAARVSSVIAVSTALICSVALPATAADTTTTLTVTVEGSGGLAIAAPASANLGSVIEGKTTAPVPLGTVTVTDNRAVIGGWTATVKSSVFESSTVAVKQTFGPEAATYNPGLATPTLNAIILPALPEFALSGSGTTVQTATVTGSNNVRWAPTLTLTVPYGTVADEYKATLTHSVL